MHYQTESYNIKSNSICQMILLFYLTKFILKRLLNVTFCDTIKSCVTLSCFSFTMH